jgi:uncharacterized protein (DUF2336 family)
MTAVQHQQHTTLTYEQTRAILEGGSFAAQRELALNPYTPREALYYLANQHDAQVRAAVAANPATPMQADELLLHDAVDDVRAELARKIGRLVPDLSAADQAKLREQAITILEALAQDQAPRVRAILVEEIKASPHVPKAIVRRLAEDPDLLVCGPILEYSPLLADHDLKEIIAAGRAKGALEHIARRGSVSGDVCAAIERTGDVAAVTALLANANAQIREDTLDAILDGAPTQDSWHEPLALRANLSARAMRRIAGFVASALVDKMVAAHVLDDDLADELRSTVRKRLESDPVDLEAQQRAEDDAAWAVSSGAFGDAWVAERLAAGARLEITYALARAGQIDAGTARKIIGSRNARTLTALAWKAGLNARTAYALQQELAHVPAALQLPPKAGKEWPLSADEMEWVLEAFA